jgi:hypothetical protein
VADVTYSELMQGRLRDPVLRSVSIGAEKSKKSN